MVIQPHTGAINIERPHNADRHVILLGKQGAHGFPKPFGFIVAGAGTGAGYQAAIFFVRGDVIGIRIAIDFARGVK